MPTGKASDQPDTAVSFLPFLTQTSDISRTKVEVEHTELSATHLCLFSCSISQPEYMALYSQTNMTEQHTHAQVAYLHVTKPVTN